MPLQCISDIEHLKIKGGKGKREGKVYEIFSLPLLKQVLTYFKTNISFIVNEFWHACDYGYILNENGPAWGWKSSEILTTSNILSTTYVH